MALGLGLALAVPAVGPVACGGAPAAFGPTPQVARTHVEDFFGGLAVRFVDVQRSAKFAAARERLGRDALNPSRLAADTVVWTTMSPDGHRVLELEGRPHDNRYSFVARSGAAAPDRPGASRHVMRLAPLRDEAWQWNTSVEHAVGRVRATAVADAFGIFLSRLERPGRDVRAELHAAMPRSTAAMGRLFTLDTVHAVPVGDGSWLVDLRVSIHPERIRGTMPALAKYVDKYIATSRYTIQLTDGRGGRWLDARASRKVLTFRLRTRGGELLALDGPARPMPESLELHTDAYVHVMLWDVGVSGMVGDFSMVRGAHERGFAVRWRRRPEWHLPLGVRHLINGTLNRPFAGSGMQLRLTVRDADAGQTLVLRRFDAAVQESAVVRWLGSLSGRAMSEFAGQAELEENRFTAEALLAVRADAARALGGLAD